MEGRLVSSHAWLLWPGSGCWGDVVAAGKAGCGDDERFEVTARWEKMDLRVISTVLDYLLVTTDPDALVPSTDVPAGSNGAIRLGPDLQIQALDDQLSERLLRACELRGERWEPARQYGVAHAFMRVVPSDDWQRQLYAWDGEQTLYTALALSRLVRPHASGCEYAVRRLIDSDGSERLVPHDAGEARVAFRIGDRSRNWLDHDEAQQLQALLAAYSPDALPTRVRRALWVCELMVRERYLEDALPLVVTGLEALLKVGRGRLTTQFAQRTAGLSREFSMEVDEDGCVAAYDDRSGIVHGAHVDLSESARSDRFVSLVGGLQRVLRAAMRRAIEHPAFAAVFEDDKAIEDRWPIRDR